MRRTYESLSDLRAVLDCGWDLPEIIAEVLASVMFRNDLDPRIASDMAEGFKLLGEDPSAFGI